MAEKNDFPMLERQRSAVDSTAESKFDTYYEHFLTQQSACSASTTLALSEQPNADQLDREAIAHNFRNHYEQFVGYSVDERLFQTCAEASAYRYSVYGLSATSKTLLRNSLMGVGSLVATAVVGSLLIYTASDTPQYTYRDYSPELFQQHDFAPAASTDSVSPGNSTAQSPPATDMSVPSSELSRAPQVSLVALQSPAQTDMALQPLPSYSVVMPSSPPPASLAEIRTEWLNSPATTVTDAPSQTLLPEQPPTSIAVPVSLQPAVDPISPVETFSASDIADDPATVNPTPADAPLPVPLSLENIGVDTAIAFRPFDETVLIADSTPTTVVPLLKEVSEKEQGVPLLDTLVE